MVDNEDLEIIMNSYCIPDADRENFKKVWKVLNWHQKIDTRYVNKEIWGGDISAVKAILDIFR